MYYIYLKRRASIGKRHYYFSVVEGTPFTVVVALQEKHFGYRVKIPEKFQNINTTSRYTYIHIYILYIHYTYVVGSKSSRNRKNPFFLSNV